jgi:hypothetical protein
MAGSDAYTIDSVGQNDRPRDSQEVLKLTAINLAVHSTTKTPVAGRCFEFIVVATGADPLLRAAGAELCVQKITHKPMIRVD